MLLVYMDVRDALLQSADGYFHSVRYSGGWEAKLEHKYESAYKATLWNADNGLTIHHFFGARNYEHAADIAARYLKRYHDTELWPKSAGESIKKWYEYTCPTDELGDVLDPSATFADYLIVLAKDGNAYRFGIDDSIIRQRIMAATAHVMGLEYDRVYDLWRV